MNKNHDFSDLDELVSTWDAPSVKARITKRTVSTLDEMQVFHDTVVPRLEKIIKFLNQFPADEIPEEYQALKNATLSILHVDRPVNKWKNVFLEGARDPRLFQMKSDFYDSGKPDS